MKKLLNALLILTPLMGYMEWADQHMFIYELEYDLLFNFREKQDAFLHPLILLPLIGQLVLIITLFQREPNKKLTFTGIALLSTIMVFLFFIGFIAKSPAIALYAAPFIVTAIITVWINLKRVQ
jgi:hypothetical protein